MTRRLLPAALVLLAVALGSARLLRESAHAQPGSSGAPQPQPGIDFGSQKATGPTWNFDGEVQAGTGPWAQVTVTNTNCDTPYRPGTAQAGAIIFTAQLALTQTQTSQTVYQGDLLPFTGSKADGHVQVITPSGPSPTTHIDAALWNLEQFALDNTFHACLTAGGSANLTAQIAADSQKVVALGYDVFGVVTTVGPDGSNFIALSATKIGTADGYTQWVFFFDGTTYLGTDTAVPSPQLSLTGSPAPGQVNVQYINYAPSDPLCCPSLPPVTITYTWNGTNVTPNGTPPGH